MSPPVDVLLVRSGTTLGQQVADAALGRLLAELGISTAVADPGLFRLTRFRLRQPFLDLAEAVLLRRATAAAVREHRPAAVLYSTATAVLLEPRRRLVRAAVRFDALPRENRPGRRNIVQRRLERRALRHLRGLLPYSAAALPTRTDLTGAAGWLPLPTPLTPVLGGPPVAPDSRLAVTYGGSPMKKRLALVVQAWTQADVPGARLVVAGVDEQRARRHLADRGVPVPDSVDFAGRLTPAAFRELTGRASVYVSGSGYEDFGIAQLEALLDGCLLVAAPGGGPYEALHLARVLDAELVAATSAAPDLARCLRRAFDVSATARQDYRRRSSDLLEPFSDEAVRRRLREQVLPLLLGSRPG